MMFNDIKLKIPTHISFTLYKYNYIDGIIISRVLKECKNYSSNKNNYKIKVNDFKNAINNSSRLRSEINTIKKISNSYDINNDPDFKPNSLFFLFKIIKSLSNVEWFSFKISHNKNYSRTLLYEGKNLINFYYKIENALIDVSNILTKKELKLFNIILQEEGLLSNEHLTRLSYFKIKTDEFIDILTGENFDVYALDIATKILNIIDFKLDDDNPNIIVKTDYFLY